MAETDLSALSPLQQDLEDRLRAWRKVEAARTGKPAFLVFGDKTLRALAIAAPTSLSQLSAVNGVGPDKLDRYGAEVLALLRGDPSAPQSDTLSTDRHMGPATRSVPAPKPPSTAPALSKLSSLTAEQQAVEDRLREWRRLASERMGMPQFFVLASAAMRNLAHTPPRSLSELQRVSGFTQEKIDQFGDDILRICND